MDEAKLKRLRERYGKALGGEMFDPQIQGGGGAASSPAATGANGRSPTSPPCSARATARRRRTCPISAASISR